MKLDFPANELRCSPFRLYPFSIVKYLGYSISLYPSYVQHNSIYRVPSYVGEHSTQLDTCWTVSGPVQIAGLGDCAQST